MKTTTLHADLHELSDDDLSALAFLSFLFNSAFRSVSRGRRRLHSTSNHAMADPSVVKVVLMYFSWFVGFAVVIPYFLVLLLFFTCAIVGFCVCFHLMISEGFDRKAQWRRCFPLSRSLPTRCFDIWGVPTFPTTSTIVGSTLSAPKKSSLTYPVLRKVIHTDDHHHHCTMPRNKNRTGNNNTTTPRREK